MCVCIQMGAPLGVSYGKELMTHPRLFEMPMNRLQPDVVSYNSAISACDKSEQWQAALHMFGP